MKEKHKNCVVVAAAAAAASGAVGAVGSSTRLSVGRVGVGAAAAAQKMKSVILYPYGPLTGTGCCRMLHAKNLAITSAIYTINISLLIVLIYCWRINVNINKSDDLEDVYYGVQIAYFAIIGTQMSMIVLSVMLIFGIYKENPGLIVPWIIGFITFMALEAVAMVYSNVLRDHVNKQFDAMCKAEVAFFIARAFINVLAMWGVLRFYNLVRSGITWKGGESKSSLTTATTRIAGRCAESAGYHRTTRYCPRHHHNLHRYRRRENYLERKAASCCAFLDFDDYDDDDDDDEYDEENGEYDYYYDDDDDCFGDDDEGNAACFDYDSTSAAATHCDYDDYFLDGVDNDDEELTGGGSSDGSDCAMLGGGRGGGGGGGGCERGRGGRKTTLRNAKRTRHCIATTTSGKRHRRSRNNSTGGSAGGGGGAVAVGSGGTTNVRSVLISKRHHKYKIAQPQTRLEVINESERSAGSGSDENDSLLVAYDSTSSLASV